MRGKKGLDGGEEDGSAGINVCRSTDKPGQHRHGLEMGGGGEWRKEGGQGEKTKSVGG